MIAEVRAKDAQGTNHSLNGTATASSTQHAGVPASNVRDNSTDTVWVSQRRYTATGNTDWVCVDLQSPKSINELEVRWRNYNMYVPVHWKFQVATASVGPWLDVKEFNNYTPPTYPTQHEAVDMAQSATWGSGVSWSSNSGDTGVGSYEREYTYDKVGNRTRMRLFAENGSTIEDVTWTMEYNGLNQLTKRYSGASWSGVSGDIRFEYTYDANGNLSGVKKETKSGSTWSQVERWAYTWTPRDQVRYATKYNAADVFAGRVEYKYCLSCDGALSERLEYNAAGTLASHRRYEYDGLNLVRLDERYDADTPPDGIDAGDPWRTLEASTHKPGALASLLHKRVYTHTNADATPEASADFTYAYDAVGNVYCAWDGDGNEVFYFAQDAFGNELPVDLLEQDSWSTARAAGITEHQTGKWIDPFTGLYYFQARYYDPAVGRFVGRDVVPMTGADIYVLAYGNPTYWIDPTGRDPVIDGCDFELSRCPVDEENCDCDCHRLQEGLQNALDQMALAVRCAIEPRDSQCRSSLTGIGRSCREIQCSILGTTPWIHPWYGVPFYNPDEHVVHTCARHCVCAHESIHVGFGRPTTLREQWIQEVYAYEEQAECLRRKIRKEDCE